MYLGTCEVVEVHLHSTGRGHMFKRNQSNHTIKFPPKRQIRTTTEANFFGRHYKLHQEENSIKRYQNTALNAEKTEQKSHFAIKGNVLTNLLVLSIFLWYSSTQSGNVEFTKCHLTLTEF